MESWDNVFSPSVRATLNPMLPSFLRGRRWFRSRTRTIRVAEIHEVVPLPKSRSYLLLIRAEFTEGDPEFYTLAVSVAMGEVENPEFILARLQGPEGRPGVLYGALRNREFCDELLAAILRRRRFAGEQGELVASHTRAFRAIWGADRPALEPTLSRADQDNTTVFYGDRFALKLLRKIEEGPHPEQEIGALLTKDGFPNAAPLAGAIEYRGEAGGTFWWRCCMGMCADAADGWQYTLDHLGLFFEGAMARSPQGPEDGGEFVGSYLETARLLGTAHGGDARSVGGASGRSGVRARALHRLLPARAVSRAAGAARPRDGSAGGATREAAGGGPPGRARR